MIVQMTDLNDERFGRFGNQLFKFFFLKIVERTLGCEIRYPNWLGCLTFNLPQSEALLPMQEVIEFNTFGSISLINCLEEIKKQRLRGIDVLDIKGFFQFHTSQYKPYKDLFSAVFSVNNYILLQVINSMERISDQGSVVGIHVRRGDYVNNANPYFFTTPIDSILKSIDSLRQTRFISGGIYIASDDPIFVIEIFKKEGLLTLIADNLFFINDDSSRLMIDFIVLSLSNAIIVSNSSLSMFSAMMNTNSKIFLRPVPGFELLKPFDPWNTDILIS